MTEMIAARCRICAMEFMAPIGPEAHSLGKYALAEHLRRDHQSETILQVYALHTPWYETEFFMSWIGVSNQDRTPDASNPGDTSPAKRPT